jgi:repressor of nif and glnA expression
MRDFGVSTFEFAVLRALHQAKRDLRRSVPTYALQARLNVMIPERTLRYHLRKLEMRGYVARPEGHRSGWACSLPVERGLRVRLAG